MVASNNFQSTNKIIIKKLLVITLSCLYFLVFPVVIFVLSPIFIIRVLVGTVSKIVRPDLGNLVLARSMMFAVDDLHVRPKCTLLVCLTVEGDISAQRLQKLFEKNIAPGSKLENKYPELQQYYYKWLGFLFWKWDEDFKIENHIKYYNTDSANAQVDTSKLRGIEEDLLTKSYSHGRSPWEIYIVKNCASKHLSQSPVSVLYLRFHHGLCDGFSIMNLMSDVLDTNFIPVAPMTPQINNFQKVFKNISFILRAPFDRISQAIDCKDVNDWHPPEEKLSNNYYLAVSEPINLQNLKMVTEAHGVSLTSVLMSGITAAIRKKMIKRNEHVPEAIHCVSPFPMPRHPNHLCNHMTAAVIRLPVGVSEPDVRLQLIHEYLLNKRSSTVPLMSFIMITLVGGLFYTMVKSLAKYNLTTAIVSNFAGPHKRLYILGHPMADLHFVAGMLTGSTAVGFKILSYAGSLQIAVRVNASILPTQEDVEEMLNYVIEEFKVLSEYTK